MRSIVHDEPLFAYGADIGMGVVELFLGQRIALMEIGPWNLGVQADGATFRWDVAPMPDGPAEAPRRISRLTARWFGRARYTRTSPGSS